MKKGKGKNSGLLPNSLRIISSCLKTVSANASTVASSVRSASASVAASVSSGSEDLKDQVTWAGFDRLELGPSVFKHVLLLGYQNGFQVLDVEDASNFSELASKRDGPVTFLQMQPFPAKADGDKGFSASYPLLLVVAGEDTNGLNVGQTPSKLGGVGRDGNMDSQSGNPVNSSMTVQFYSLRSHSYVHVLRFRSAVRMVRCSPRIVAVGLATQIYCFDALTLESKFSVLTYPIPQLSGQGNVGVNVGYGPMAVGPRWLAYASCNPLISSTGRLSPQNLTPSPGVSPSTSPGSSSLMARYAMESSKHLAAGIINLGDMGYKTLSKYCQELLPDGSNSPVSPSSSWKAGRLAGAEMDNAGMVVVKDFVSRSVISQFKAHTSPISALCFDPSGTLLVTASVYGNNINIFRIMPSCTRSGPGSQNYEWSSSHVHLYKLHRGITSATIQDICFSHYSQWISIVSSKGTCHIFVLSPFGGDVGFQTHNSKGEEPSLFPVSSSPWWSTSSFVTSQKLPIPPPTPVVLSVVSRVKYNDSGWLNTVSNVAASATGKVFVPSGAIAAVFHSSVSVNAQQVNSKANSLEHLLVYTPSGHVIQHKLLPSVGTEQSDSSSRTRPGSFLQIQEDDLRVKVEPVQWWDVCRRSDWPERAECVFQTTFKKQDAAEVTLDKLGSKDCYGVDSLDINKSSVGKKFLTTDPSKPHERSHWYLSNAEVQISCGRLPIWHKSKISFYTMDSPRGGEDCKGELEVEKVSINEVEMRWKELLPVFDNFHNIKSGWGDRDHDGEKYPVSSLEPHQAKDKTPDESVICHSKPSSLGSTESSDGGSSRRMENFPDLDQMNMEKAYIPNCQSLNGFYQERPESAIFVPAIDNLKLSSYPSIPSEYLSKAGSCVDGSNLPVAEGADAAGLNGVTTSKADPFDSKVSVFVNGVMQSNVNHEVDFGQFLQEGHCKALESDATRGSLTQVIADDVDSGEKDKHEDEEENDDMLGGMFAFSEEG